MIQWLTGYLRKRREAREAAALEEVKARYHAFRIFLENNGRALELVIALDGLLEHGTEDEIRIDAIDLLSVCGELVDGLHLLSGGGHGGLFTMHARLADAVNRELDGFNQLPGETVLCMALDDLGPGSHRHAGSKAAGLAQLRRMNLPVMDGFVVTTQACNRFLSGANLVGPIRPLLGGRGAGDRDMSEVAGEIRELIMAAPLPDDLQRELDSALGALRRRSGMDELPLSVRSSAVAEDRAEHSFAGQFTSVLNVRGDAAVARAYREVVASAFSARALAYRRTLGLSPMDFDMAVLCQIMVDARCSGVALSRDPAAVDSGTMLVSASSGLGTTAVDGSAPVDLYRPLRTDTPEDAASDLGDGGAEIAHKTEREVLAEGGGLRREPVPADEADRPLLDAATLRELVRHAERIESLEGLPLDMEWAVDRDGEIRILQARPLRLPVRRRAKGGMRTEAPVLATGFIASPGKAVGRARVVRTAEELDRVLVPDADGNGEPGILVLPQGLVDAARQLDAFEGAVVDVGNPTDHLSCVAREYGVPMLTGTGTASVDIPEGTWIVVDGDNGQVLQAGASLWTDAGRRPRTRQREAAPRRPVLSPQRARLRELIVPLNLTDAYGPTFRCLECRSLHDLVRYSHEMAVLAMFEAGDDVMEEAGGLLRPLQIGVPFHFLVIDLGGALRRTGRRRALERDDVLSAPLAALCDGLASPGLNWHSRPPGGAVAQAVSRNMLDATSARPAGSFNYALAARDYLNLNARVEFHFAMLDAVCGSDERANHIRFRFKGGGTGQVRCNRRAVFLQRVLEANDFVTVVNGDLVTASLVGAQRDVIHDRLVMLGRLLGFSRFLDGVMHDDDTPGRLAEAFLDGGYDTREVAADGENPPV